jgi:hypothetical protein
MMLINRDIQLRLAADDLVDGGPQFVGRDRIEPLDDRPPLIEAEPLKSADRTAAELSYFGEFATWAVRIHRRLSRWGRWSVVTLTHRPRRVSVSEICQKVWTVRNCQLAEPSPTPGLSHVRPGCP